MAFNLLLDSIKEEGRRLIQESHEEADRIRKAMIEEHEATLQRMKEESDRANEIARKEAKDAHQVFLNSLPPNVKEVLRKFYEKEGWQLGANRPPFFARL